VRLAVVNSIRAYGGGEKWVLRFAGCVAGRGHTITVVGSPGGELARRCEAEQIPFSPVLLRHDVSPAAMIGLARALRKAEADVVICCNERAARVGVIAARLARPDRPLPVVYRNGLEGSFKNKAHNRLLVGPRVARYVVNAEATRQELLAFGWVPPDRLRLIYNGVAPAPLDAAVPTGVREELGAAPDAVVALVAARLAPEKGHALVIDAVAELAAAHPRLRVWMAGEGPEAERLRAAVQSRGVGGRVRLLGFRPDVPRLMRAADLFCHPSRREGAPNAVLEAMAAGLPVVAVAASGTSELVTDGETGLLSPVGDDTAFRRNLAALASDPDLRRRLGAAGRARALDEFSEARSTDRWLELLAEVGGDA